VGYVGYQKINLEIIVFSEDTDAVVKELNWALDRLEQSRAIFGGGIETTSVKHSGTERKAALRRTLHAANTATSAVRLATQKVSDAYKRVI
jgi:hypothetical protein